MINFSGFMIDLFGYTAIKCELQITAKVNYKFPCWQTQLYHYDI